MKARKTSAKRVGAKRQVPHKAAKRPARKVVIDKNDGIATDAESVTLLGDVARLYLRDSRRKELYNQGVIERIGQ